MFSVINCSASSLLILHLCCQHGLTYVIFVIFHSYRKFYRSSKSGGMDIANLQKNSTFAPELFRELF